MENEILRYIFRCFDCLSVFATQDQYETELEFPRCPCGGKVLYMGPVTKNPIYWADTVSACDGRCTEAKGNSCDCVCGGLNHMTGKVIEVKHRIDIDAPKQKGIDYEYGESVRRRINEIKQKCPAIQLIESGQYVHDKSEWRKAITIQSYLREIKYALSKAKRERLFKKIETQFFSGVRESILNDFKG